MKLDTKTINKLKEKEITCYRFYSMLTSSLSFKFNDIFKNDNGEEMKVTKGFKTKFYGTTYYLESLRLDGVIYKGGEVLPLIIEDEGGWGENWSTNFELEKYEETKEKAYEKFIKNNNKNFILKDNFRYYTLSPFFTQHTKEYIEKTVEELNEKGINISIVNYPKEW